MIKLYQFPRAFGLPNPSPFCMKVEAYLRMAELDYEIVEVHDPRPMPKGKCPVIEDRGTKVPDSAFIFEYLQRSYQVKIDAGLSDSDKAVAHAFGRMLEERFYWTLVYSRWMDNRCWPALKKEFFDHMPPLVKHVLPSLIRNNVRKQLHAQGMGRHSEEEIYALAAADLGNVSAYLADKPYFLGDTPRSIDTIVYSFVANALQVPFRTPLQEAGRSLDNLVKYCERMHAAYMEFKG